MKRHVYLPLNEIAYKPKNFKAVIKIVKFMKLQELFALWPNSL